MNKITLVITARFTSNIDVITGFRDLEHAQCVMLAMINEEVNEPYAELEDNESMDTAENNYYITESRDINGRTPEQIADDDFFTSLLEQADNIYGSKLSQQTRDDIRGNDIHTLENLYDNEQGFSLKEFEAIEEALEIMAAMERI